MSSAARGRSGYDERGEGEAPYRGKVGATRTEPVHLSLADGRTRSINVHVGINVGSDPHLREAALTGALHRFEGGEELAVPFVFHDPVQKRLCIVIPESLRHTALSERAKLLAEIASDREVAVPPYARDAGVVVGSAGLHAYLEAPDERATTAARAQAEDLLGAQRTALDMERGEIERLRAQMERDRTGVERERAAIERDRSMGGAQSSANAAREAELQAERQALVAERQDLSKMRAELDRDRQTSVADRQELATLRAGHDRDRQTSVADRQELATLRAALDRDRREFEVSRTQLEQREVRVRERAESVTSREDELRSQAEEIEATTRDLAMREEELTSRLEALGEREQALALRVEAAGADDARRAKAGGSVPPPARRHDTIAAPGSRPIVEPAGESMDDVEEIDELEPVSTEAGRARGPLGDEGAVDELVDDDDVEEEVDADTLGVREETTGVHGAGEVEGPKTAIVTPADIAAGLAAVAAETGPRLPEGLRDREMSARLDDGVDLDVRLPEGVDGLGELDLLVQLSDAGGPPIVLLTLTMGASGHRIARRAALDPRVDADRAVLEQLRRRYEARLHFYAHDGRPFDEGRVTSSREANLTRILDRVQKLRGGGAKPDLAKARALEAPPPVSEPNPFTEGDEGRLGSAAQLSRAVVELAEWLSPERFDHALTVLSIPRDTVDGTITRTLERALELGLSLPPPLVERAIASGLARDVPGLVSRLIDAFQRTMTRPDRGALDEQAIATNWERLLAAAAEGEIALDPETHEIAVRAIRAVRGETTGAGPSGEVDPARLAEMAPPELVVMLDHPKYRRVAAVALAERGDAAFADVLCKAVRKMPRAEVVRVAPRLVRLGEEAGDALIDGLSARKTFVRQAFALTLAHLKLRRAVVPLLHRLTAEDAPIHRELARVVGSFGNAAFRPLVRQLADPKAPEDRMVRALAHLSIQGCEKQVDELTRDADGRIAGMATRALSMRDEVRKEEDTVSGKRPLDDSDPVVAFSRRFEEELRGTAPETDLATAEDER